MERPGTEVAHLIEYEQSPHEAWGWELVKGATLLTILDVFLLLYLDDLSGDFYFYSVMWGIFYLVLLSMIPMVMSTTRMVFEDKRLYAIARGKRVLLPFSSVEMLDLDVTLRDSETAYEEVRPWLMLRGFSAELGNIPLVSTADGPRPELRAMWQPVVDENQLETTSLLDSPMPEDPNVRLVREGVYRMPCGSRWRMAGLVVPLVLPQVLWLGWHLGLNKSLFRMEAVDALMPIHILTIVGLAYPLMRMFSSIVIERGDHPPRVRRYFGPIPLGRWLTWGPNWTLCLSGGANFVYWTLDTQTPSLPSKTFAIFCLKEKGPSLETLLWLTAQLRNDWGGWKQRNASGARGKASSSNAPKQKPPEAARETFVVIRFR